MPDDATQAVPEEVALEMQKAHQAQMQAASNYAGALTPDPEYQKQYLRGQALEMAFRIVGDAKGDHQLVIRAARDLLVFLKEG